MYKPIGKKVSLDLKLKSFNAACILFDIDGVLVDVRKSYNIAIKKTVDFTLKYITGKSNLNGLVTDKMILKLRQTGCFNNDADTSYAITLAALANPQKSVNYARKFLFTVAKNIDESGIISVEKFLSSCSSFHNIQKLKELLVYPASVGESLLATVFDELFYGPELFKKQHRVEPKYYFGKPLIQNDKLVANRTTMNALSKKFSGNIAVVSGRSRLAAEYSLKPIFDIFNQNACIFLEDQKREYAKPDSYAIKRAMKTMGVRTAIYVGDSAEDMLMARRAEKEIGVKIAFFGIYGCSTEPTETVRQFKKNGADAIIENINQLPNVLNKVLAKV
jgi:phosphoglycolate phosphatase-like HAD superfamily hydrolase